MVDREEGVLWSKVFDDRVYSHDSITRITIPITKGIAGWVVANGKGCRVADAYADPRYGCAATVMPRARMCVCGLWCVAVCDCVWLCDCVAMWLCVAMCGCECVAAECGWDRPRCVHLVDTGTAAGSTRMLTSALNSPQKLSSLSRSSTRSVRWWRWYKQ